jgi:hypothetical protein
MVSKGPRTTFGLAGNAVLDALVAKIADNLRFHHAIGGKVKLRTFAGSFSYWKGAPHSRD